jgi:hypothetical protein
MGKSNGYPMPRGCFRSLDIESRSQGQCLALTAWRASSRSRQDVEGTGFVAEEETES